MLHNISDRNRPEIQGTLAYITPILSVGDFLSVNDPLPVLCYSDSLHLEQSHSQSPQGNPGS